MPDAAVLPPAVRQAALERVGAWAGRLPGTRRLRSEELAEYRKRGPTDGWRLEVLFAEEVRRFDLLLCDGFPRRAPLIVLVDRPVFLTWPHVEEDGVLCLLGDDAAVDHADPAAVASNLMAEAAALVEDLIAGRREEDFRDEFETYWMHTVDDQTTPVYSLLEPKPPSRLVRLWPGRAFRLAGEDQETVAKWLGNRFPSGGPRETISAALLWLERPMTPREFPRTAQDVLRLAEDCGGRNLVESLAAGDEKKLVLLGATSRNGPCLAAVMLPKPEKGPNATPTKGVDGFREGKAPRKLVVKRTFGGERVIPLRVERVDARWIHGRGRDPNLDRLRAAGVAVIGCGSVGAGVAVQLAAAGIGRLTLIDPQMLQPANIGRHPLGAEVLGRAKAAALAEKLRIEFPHVLEIKAIGSRWEAVEPEAIDQLAACSLIVCATGNWAAESTLDAWRRIHRRGPIVYGWSEPHAAAGHAVTIAGSGGCLQCGFSTSGLPLFRATAWERGSTTEREPGCGAVYQPYGPVELGHVNSLIAETALDCLLGRITESTSRTWAARRSFLENAGGRWSDEWSAAMDHRAEGGFIFERTWPVSAGCGECGRST